MIIINALMQLAAIGSEHGLYRDHISGTAVIVVPDLLI